MTRLPSLQRIVPQAGRVAWRFPFPLLCACVVCVAGCQAITSSNTGANQAGWVFPLLSASALGLPLTPALELAAERYS